MLVAEGAYAYVHQGQDAGVTESWSIRQDDQGHLITQSIRDASAYHSRIEVNAVAHANAVTAFDVVWRNHNSGMVNSASARYQLSGMTIHIRRAINNADEAHRLKVAAPPIMFPLMRVFTGDVIVKLAQSDAPLDVLTPNIANPADAANLLMPKIEPRRAAFLHTEDLEIAGKMTSARCYSYISEQYDDKARFWVDAHRLLLRYTWGQWDVFLDRYDRPT